MLYICLYIGNLLFVYDFNSGYTLLYTLLEKKNIYYHKHIIMLNGVKNCYYCNNKYMFNNNNSDYICLANTINMHNHTYIIK